MSKEKLRRAVGAIVRYKNQYLLVHKVKDVSANKEIEGQWDFVKGGLDETDKDLHAAILRELNEETGSDNYRILKEFNTKICFHFPENHKYVRQETTMFLVEFLGEREDLEIQDDEIDDIKFYNKEEVRSLITLKETKAFMNNVSW